MIDKVLFGKRLRELREKQGYTQEKLSDLLDIEWQHVSRLENGKNLPSCAILLKIADVFDIDVRTLTDYEYLNSDTNIDKLLSDLLLKADLSQKKMFYKILKAILK